MTDSPAYTEVNYSETELHPMIDPMENSPFREENIVFEGVVKGTDGQDYRVVVTNDGKYAFVDMNYMRPMQFLDGMDARDAAIRLGFDESSLNKGRSR